MAVCWCGREHRPNTAIGAAHAHREHPAMFLAYPFQPRCRCGWHGHVFYKDAYHALGHWWEHAESALTEAGRKGYVRGLCAGAIPFPASVSALNAPAAPRQKQDGFLSTLSSCPDDCSRQPRGKASSGTPAAGALNA